MKHLVLVLLLQFLIIDLVTAQDRIDSGYYCSPTYILGPDCYYFNSDTFELYQHKAVVKGVYNIINDSIYFHPIGPNLLNKSKYNYSKKTTQGASLTDSIVTFIFNTSFSDSDVTHKGIIIWAMTRDNHCLMSFTTNGDTLELMLPYNRRLAKFEISSCDGECEVLELAFDAAFQDQHLFEIILCPRTKFYLERENFSYKLLFRNNLGFIIKTTEGLVEFRNNKYSTDDFRGSWLRQLNKLEKEEHIIKNEN